jgi:hypothetical protein
MRLAARESTATPRDRALRSLKKLDDHSSDDFGAGGHDGVSEGLKSGSPCGGDAIDGSRGLPKSRSVAGSSGPSVHPSGNPIRASTHDGLAKPPSFADMVSKLGDPFVR